MTSTFLIINDELCLVKHNKFSNETSNFRARIKINMKGKKFKTKKFIHCYIYVDAIFIQYVNRSNKNKSLGNSC